MVPLSVPRKCAVLLEPVEDVEPHGARPPLALAERLCAVQEGGGDVDVVVCTPDLADLEGAAASVLRQHPIYDFQAFCATASRGDVTPFSVPAVMGVRDGKWDSPRS